MSSKLFREELERVVTDSLRDSGADGISNLLSDMMSVKQVSLIRCLNWNNVLLKSITFINSWVNLSCYFYFRQLEVLEQSEQEAEEPFP